jgi:hypothetical protein
VAETDPLKMIKINFSSQSVTPLPTVWPSAFLNVSQTQYYSGKVDETREKCGTLEKKRNA